MKKNVWWTNDSKNKEIVPFLPREALIYLKTFSVLLLLSWKRKIHNVLKLAESNQFLHTHTHTRRVVLFLGYVPYPKTLSLSFMFICFSCTRVLLSLLWSCLYFHDSRPSRVNFIWTSQWICVYVYLNHSDVCIHSKSVSLSFHFMSKVRFWGL